MRPPTNILVPGRAQNHLPNGGLELSDSGKARVDEAERHYRDNRAAFCEGLDNGSGGLIVMAGGYAALASSNQVAATPYHFREGTQMYDRALRRGIPPEHLANSPSSRSTLENVLSVHADGHFTAISPDNPLGIVTENHTADEEGEDGQYSQWARLLWFVTRVYKLPKEAVVLIPTRTVLTAAEQADERKLMRITKRAYGMARTPAGLCRAESLVGLGARTLTKFGLQKPPASRYAQLGG
jgi:hypothetical protein